MFYIILVIIILACYTVIPDFFLHRLGLGARKRQHTSGVALTFDDGPDPEYTPRILKVLDRHGTKATFFVVGEKAARHPEMIKEIIARGHQIGVHSMHHTYAWLEMPWKTWRQWQQAVSTVETVIGQEVKMVRPPWGTFNLFTWLWIKTHRKKAILWDTEGHDWQAHRTPQEIAARIVHKVWEGSIIVMHDSGGEKGAPENTIQALDMVSREIVTGKKLPLAALQFPDWSIWRRLTLTLWGRWEHIFAVLYHVDRMGANNIIRLSKTRYDGPDLYLNDGRLVAKKGDQVAEIHFDNLSIQHEQKEVSRIAVQAMRMAKESFPGMALFVKENPGYKDINAFLGVTLLHRGVKKFGFHVQEVPQTRFTRWVGFLERIIMRIYNPQRTEAGKNITDQPKLAWISREELLNRWLPDENIKELYK